MKTPARLATAALCAAMISATASAATLSITASEDSYIRRSVGTNNYGSDGLLFVADTSTTNDGMRTLLNFDLGAAELSGATINSVTLTLYINSSDTGASIAGTQTIQVYQLNNAFAESTVTWGNSSGGAYNSASLLSSTTGDATTVTAGQQFTFGSSENFTGIVSSLVSQGGDLNLLLRLATEDTTRSVFRFSSTESANASYYPVLTIDYTPSAIPEPSAFAALAGLGALGLVASRRRARR